MLRERLSREGGFSLVELMIIVAIVGVLVALAIPAYLESKPLRQLRADTMDLASNLKLTKMNAVKRGVDTGIFFDAGARDYTIYEDDGPTDNQFDGGDTVVEGNIALRGATQFNSMTCPNNTIIFTASGTAVPSSGTVTLGNPNTPITWDVVVNPISGRVSIQ